VERAIAGIWQEVLRVERVGLYDNFFDLGGHSLLLVRVLDRVRQALPGEPTMLDLFRYPTVAALARHLGRDRAESGRSPALGGATDEDDWVASVAERAAMLREAMSRRVAEAGEETAAPS
jgi:acyl carrier protein